MSEPLADLAAARPLSWRSRLLWIGLWLVFGGILAWAATFIGWEQVGEALRKADPVWVGMAIAANLCGLPMWAQAIRLFTPAAEPKPFWPVLGVLAIIVAAIQSLSIFAGAATAAVLFVRRVGMSTGAMISVLALEQLSSGIAKVLLIGAAILSTSAPVSLKAAGGSLLLVVALLFAVLVWGAHSGEAVARLARHFPPWIARWILRIGEWTSHLEALREPRRYFAAVLLTLGRRMMETSAILCTQKAIGIPVSVELGLLVIAAIALATIIPGPPGNLGMYEAAVVLAYSWGGVGAETAVAAALLQHFAFLVAALTPGYILLMVWRGRIFERAG